MPHFRQFRSMARKPKEIEADKAKMAADTVKIEEPVYPYGLCLSFDNDQLDTLELDGECDVGDVIHLCCMAKVTSCSKRDTTDGPKRHIELQITDIALENEDEENRMDDGKRMEGRYGIKSGKGE